MLWTFVRVEKRCAKNDDADELSISHVRKERERKGAEKPPQTLFITKRKKKVAVVVSLSLSPHSLTNMRTKKSEGNRVEEQKQKTRTDQSPVGHLHERRHVVIIPLSVKLLYTICSFRARASRFGSSECEEVSLFSFLFSLFSFSRKGAVTCQAVEKQRTHKKEVRAREKISTRTPPARRFCVIFVATTTTDKHTQKKRDGIVIDER